MGTLTKHYTALPDHCNERGNSALEGSFALRVGWSHWLRVSAQTFQQSLRVRDDGVDDEYDTQRPSRRKADESTVSEREVDRQHISTIGISYFSLSNFHFCVASGWHFWPNL